MNARILIPEKYFYYLEKFGRSSYKSAFEQYYSETSAFFSALDAYPEACNKAAGELIELIESMLPKYFRRKLTFFDLKRLIFLYTVPAAIGHGSESSIAFVDALRIRWNERYPEDVLNAARFEEINGSFNNTIMGFQFGGNR